MTMSLLRLPVADLSFSEKFRCLRRHQRLELVCTIVMNVLIFL